MRRRDRVVSEKEATKGGKKKKAKKKKRFVRRFGLHKILTLLVFGVSNPPPVVEKRHAGVC